MASPAAAFGLLLIATGALGFGFGATVMALNTYAQNFFPQNPDRAVLALNALLGTGTALAPLFVSILLGLGVWWALPILVACALALILPYVLKEPLRIASSGAQAKADQQAVPSASCRRASGFMRRAYSSTGLSRRSMGTGRRCTSACSEVSRRKAHPEHSRPSGPRSRLDACSLLRFRKGAGAMDLRYPSRAAGHRVSGCLTREQRNGGDTCLRVCWNGVLRIFTS